MKIALNTYSLRKEWKVLTKKSYEPVAKFIKMLDGVTEIEMLDRTFKSKSKELTKVQKTFEDYGLKIFSIGPHPHPLTGSKYRNKEIKEINKWTDIVEEHGIHNFRLSLGGGHKLGKEKPKDNDEAVLWTDEVLRPALEYAEGKGVNLCIETHHKYSSNPDFQEKLLDALSFKNLGFIFDIGNYENDELRWNSLALLLNKNAVKYVHAKAYKFDDNGFETTLDYPRAVKSMMDAGLDINLSIEWEGKMPSIEGIFHTYELCKYSIATARGETYEMKTNVPKHGDVIKSLL